MDTSSLKDSYYNGNGNNNAPRIYLTPSPLEQSSTLHQIQDDDWDLRQVFSVAKRRSLLIGVVTVACMGATVGLTLQQKPIYEAKFQILAESVNSDDGNLQKVTALVERNLTNSGLDYESQIQVLKSPELMSSMIKRLQVAYPEIDYDSLLKDLTITRVGETKIIEVRYKSNDPAKIKAVLDKLSQTYLKYSLENRQTNLRQGIKFLEQQLPALNNRVDLLQQQLQKFRQKHSFIDPKAQSEQIGNEVKLLSEQRLAINQQLAKQNAQLKNLQQPEGTKAVLRDAPVYQNLMTQLRQLEAQTAYELTRFTEESIPIKVLQEKRQRLLPLLQQEAQRVWTIRVTEVKNEIYDLERQSQVITNAEKQLHQKLEQLPVLTRRYTELQRNLQVATDSLNRFLTTRETLQVEIAQTQVPWQLVQAPVQPEEPISPSIPRNLALGFVASTLLGIGSALVFEKLDNTYHTIDAFKEKLKLPLLTTIPFEKQFAQRKNRHTTQTNSTAQFSQDSAESEAILQRASALAEEYSQYESSRFLESLRVLYTNIQLLSSDRPIRSIIISSTAPGEGKTTTAYYLAQTACAMGRRVLLVDADLRKPQIHAIANLNNLWGLSSIISGNTPVNTAIRQLPSMSEFSIITSGPIPPDATKLLSSQKMKQLMAGFHQDFDLVIYDAPPLLGLADATLLAPNTDGIVLVTRMHKTDRTALSQTMDNLKMSRMNVLGMVVNGHKNNSSQYYKYY